MNLSNRSHRNVGNTAGHNLGGWYNAISMCVLNNAFKFRSSFLEVDIKQLRHYDFLCTRGYSRLLSYSPCNDPLLRFRLNLPHWSLLFPMRTTSFASKSFSWYPKDRTSFRNLLSWLDPTETSAYGNFQLDQLYSTGAADNVVPEIQTRKFTIRGPIWDRVSYDPRSGYFIPRHIFIPRLSKQQAYQDFKNSVSKNQGGREEFTRRPHLA